MVNQFLVKCKKCPKLGSKCQNFASLRARTTIFSNVKHIIKLNEIQEMGSTGAFKLHSVTFKS